MLPSLLLAFAPIWLFLLSGAAADSLTSTFTLRDGKTMPKFGLGVYMSDPGSPTQNAVQWALEAGYRMIDTAKIYENEKSVGKGIVKSGIPRSDIFVATKLWDDDHGYDHAQKAIREQLKDLGMDYVDLYLIHSPNTGKLVETWDALIDMRNKGLARSVGVSNFGLDHLKALKEHGRELPVVNQIEMHPLNWKEREGLMNWCKEHGILVQAYGSMFFGEEEHLATEAVEEVAAAHGKSNAQVLLRWGKQMGFQIIPKSVNKARIIENSQIFDFELSSEEMDKLSALAGSAELDAYWQPLDEPVDLGDLSRKPPAQEL
eukprot:TRINITY_DN19976_c0_g1_i1.p1 TRINITY_DN19976_c0_g1~~TRINITY_DN19976_c0_g1_i1.p1  ORF type:complete len:317 (-),score=68.70 TRINITY_DN19976_c0_g1_i1:173-1123(-)